ncbi:UNVERIFIED_CONTAM: hypothetical protein PYX00_004192 [Menopon gallinae]|uniref:39S ribosomal protein L35, mitochondrial n=1 Tax=Menopon gallinae TaxID=328185 RepID=A0AAW2I3N0_9NEOP
MFRSFFSLFSKDGVQRLVYPIIKNGAELHIPTQLKPVSSTFCSLNHVNNNVLFQNPSVNVQRNNLLQQQNSRKMATFIKYSLKNGERETSVDVLNRFYRLNCGNWIRTIAGRYGKRWKRSAKRRCRIKEHVFCNGTQSMMLDKMVHKDMRKPTYFIKSPYEPYEWREDFYVTRRKPWRPEGCDYE